MFEIKNKDFLLNDITKYNLETKEMCNQVIYELTKQEEILINTDNKLNESQENMKQTKKILNNMTWSGWFLSFLPSFKFKELSSILYKKNNNRIAMINNTIDNDNNTIYNNNTIDKDIYLIQLEKDLIHLKCIGKQIGQCLDLHNSYIDSIANKSHNLVESIKTNNKKTTNLL
jgi:uncharacterized protein YjgD (DUF1641 family)